MTVNCDITRRLEDRFCIYSRHNLYIMFGDVEIQWEWSVKESREFDYALKAGLNLLQLAERFNRSQEEIVLMTIDRLLRDTVARSVANAEGDYIMLENIEINWFWDMKDVVMFDLYHKMGLNYQMIADKLGRTEAEIIIMTFDRALQDRIGLEVK